MAIVPVHLQRRRALVPGAQRRRRMVVNNASFNCNAAKMLITAEGLAAARHASSTWSRRALAEAPPRKAYYPGAVRPLRDAHRGPRATSRSFGQADRASAAVGARSATSTPATRRAALPHRAVLRDPVRDRARRDDPVEFLAAATAFMQRPPVGHAQRAHRRSTRSTRRTRRSRRALDRAIVELRYGTVAHQPLAGARLRARVAAVGRPPERHAGGHPERPRLGAQHVHVGRASTRR